MQLECHEFQAKVNDTIIDDDLVFFDAINDNNLIDEKCYFLFHQ
jgi:hypothetical protein